MNINPGDLDKKIQIIEKVNVPGTSGFPISSTEQIIRQPWAAFKRTTGKEKIQSGTEMSSTEARFIIRASSTEITTKMIIRYDGNDYEIKYINEYNDSKEYIEIWTELVV